jgi:hypothetical protein
MQQTCAHTDQPLIATEGASQWEILKHMRNCFHHIRHLPHFPITTYPVVVTSFAKLFIKP